MTPALPRTRLHLLAAILCLYSTLPAQPPAHRAAHAAPTTLSAQIRAITAAKSLARTRWGISVTALDGTPVFVQNEQEKFLPASNVKLFTTAAALATLPPTRTWQTTLSATGSKSSNTLRGSITISSDGDAFLSTRQMPYSPDQTLPVPSLAPLDSLASALADKLHAAGISTVEGDIIARDLLPADPHAPGTDPTDLPWGYAAPITGLLLNDNELALTVTPAAKLRDPAHIALAPDLDYFTIQNSVRTVPGRRAILSVHASGRTLSISGRIGLHAAPDTESIALPDPSPYITAALKSLLAAHGINVTAALASSAHSINISVTHTSPPLLDDIVLTNKTSFNLHADLILRHLAQQSSPAAPTFAASAAVLRTFAISAGIAPADIQLYDGSGLSTLDRATPRAFTTLLRYANTQPWVTNFKSSLPVAAVDGTLKDRFTHSSAAAHVFAKTGTHSAGRSLSGYITCASGRTLAFSILVNGPASGSTLTRNAIDRVVEAIYSAY